jgi:hypothetical protein
MKIPPLRGSQALVAIVFAVLAIRLFRLTGQYAVNVFFWDQWDFNEASLFGHHSIWEIFRFQHGPHRQGAGGLLAAMVEPWFRWNSRTEAFLVTAIVVVAGLCMLWLKRRLFGPLTWTDVVIPMIVFTPAQWESEWSTANLAHGILPVLLIVLYCLAWTWRNDRAKYALITALNLVTLYTGFGFFLGLLTPVLLLAEYRRDHDRAGANRRYLLTCLAISVVSLASFFVGYRNEDASGCPSLFSAPPMAFAQFFSLMFASPFELRGTGPAATMVGVAVFAAVAAIGAINWKRLMAGKSEERPVQIVLVTLSAYSILFCAAATMGRTCTGLAEAHSSRYAIYKQLAVLGLFFWTLSVHRPVWRKALPALLVILLIPSIFITAEDAEGMADFYKLKSGWRACYLRGIPADDCDDRNGAIYPYPAVTHLQEKLDYLRAMRLNLFSDTPEVRK